MINWFWNLFENYFLEIENCLRTFVVFNDFVD
jgi:hypothetical protein